MYFCWVSFLLFLNVSYPYPICLHVIIYFTGVLELFLCNLCKGVSDFWDLLKVLQQPWCIKTLCVNLTNSVCKVLWCLHVYGTAISMSSSVFVRLLWNVCVLRSVLCVYVFVWSVYLYVSLWSLSKVYTCSCGLYNVSICLYNLAKVSVCMSEWHS